jgi:hypothetical protein
VYIEPNGQGFKNRTMPGRRSKSQLGQNEHPSDELPLATPPLTSEAPTYNPAYVDQPELQLSVDIPLPFDTTSFSALSTLFPQSTLAEPLTGNPPITLCYAATPQSTLSTATSNQAGYYNAMRATLPNLNPPVPSAFSLDTEEDDNEESDDEGIKRIICTIPRLFGTVDDTSIEFVLENCKPCFGASAVCLYNSEVLRLTPSRRKVDSSHLIRSTQSCTQDEINRTPSVCPLSHFSISCLARRPVDEYSRQ